MASNMKLFLTLIGILQCDGISWGRRLENIDRRVGNDGLIYRIPAVSRRFYQYDPRELSSIMGVPSRASHLPEAEPILPGHTLLRPSFGMLKSALKFPHKESDEGAGVYGNIENLGIKYDSRNERLMYSGFRRSPSDYIMVIPSPSKAIYEKPRFTLKTVVLDLDRRARAKNEILKILKKFNIPELKGFRVFVATDNGDNSITESSSDLSYYLNEKVPKDVLYKLNKQPLRIQKDSTADLKMPIKMDSSRESRTIPVVIQSNNKNKGSWITSLDTFNRIKINQEAPELDELLPSTDDAKIRKWWFYNADDYQPFSRQGQN